MVGFALLFVGTVGYAVYLTATSRFFLSGFLLLIVAISAGLGAIVLAYVKVGWRIDTSIHGQGPENLLMVAAFNFGTIAVWLAVVRARRSRQETAPPKRP